MNVSNTILLMLQEAHHPFIHGPLHGIDNERSDAANAQSSNENASAFRLICMFGDLDRAPVRSSSFGVEESLLLACANRVRL